MVNGISRNTRDQPPAHARNAFRIPPDFHRPAHRQGARPRLGRGEHRAGLGDPLHLGHPAALSEAGQVDRGAAALTLPEGHLDGRFLRGPGRPSGPRGAGVYFSRRLDHDRQCILVLIGADEFGRKEVLAIADGYRESTPSWREVLVDLSAVHIFRRAPPRRSEARTARSWSHGRNPIVREGNQAALQESSRYLRTPRCIT